MLDESSVMSGFNRLCDLSVDQLYFYDFTFIEMNSAIYKFESGHRCNGG